MKRDDLTGLGGGGNKARKLEFLCGAALDAGARALVTVGAAQSNHCRMTAAAGARLGLEVHLVLSGDRPDEVTGNQLLSMLFGAQLHFTGAEESHWGELEMARESLTEQLVDEGLAPYAIPIGGSTAVGALGYAAAFIELLDQFEAAGVAPSHVVFTSSSGGTHAGLLAGRAAAAHGGRWVPDVIAIGVAKGVNIGRPDIAELANHTLTLMGSTAIVAARGRRGRRPMDRRGLCDTDGGRRRRHQMGGTPRRLAARPHLFWQGMFGVCSDWPVRADSAIDVVFIHTGGWPALFAAHGVPPEPSGADR